MNFLTYCRREFCSMTPLPDVRSEPIVLVGAGKMGGAMLEGWLKLGLDPKKITVVEPNPSGELRSLATRGFHLMPEFPAGRAAACVIAVKPQSAPEVMGKLAPLIAGPSVVISIMAGRTLAFLQKQLPERAAIVRAMPNTPAAVGRGITVAVANEHTRANERELADQLLGATGAVEWIDNEQLMDAVTAVSGSGPAYVFLLAECLARAGVVAGLPQDLAGRLARATVAGSGELLWRSTLEAAALRVNVTSPGGTTAAALDVLMGPNGFASLMEQAVAAATRRSRELAN
jgi:pyrroline-5-carboxylate reductase